LVNKLQIVIINSSLGLGGAERVVATLANAWAEKGYQLTILVFSDDKASSFYLLHPNVVLKPLNLLQDSKNLFQFFKNALKKIQSLRAEIRQLKPTVVISFSTETNLLTLMATRFLTCQVIVSERSNPMQYPAKQFFKILRRLLYPWADWVVLQTEESKSYFAGSKNIKVINNPLKKFELDKEFNLTNPKPFIIALGRLSREKGFDELIDAFARIAKTYPEWKLLILGEGPLRQELELQIAREHLQERVELLGAVKQPENYIKEAEFFVLSSHFEGFPNALCEAMALGIPSIAYDCQFGPTSLIESGINGILVESRNQLKLSEAIEKLIQNPNLRKSLGERAVQIKRRLSLEVILSEWDKILRKEEDKP
jgi:GalNAc-alpha-(1->4)-GalNAc-alpha-(1->3)-diNAcBac-PP-undecaprenol alpha-1,4-N-acetyl-D-galactosaminyltransferase